MRTLRVFIDLQSARSGGGLTYACEMIPRLVRNDRITVIGVLASSELVHTGLFTKGDVEVVTASHLTAFTRNLASLRRISKRADVAFVPTEIPSYPYSVFVGACRNMKTLLGPRLERSVKTTRDIARHYLAKQASRRALGYIAPSHVAREAARAHLLRGVAKPVTVVHHGATQLRSARSRPRASAGHLVVVGNLGRHKNTRLLIDALDYGLAQSRQLVIIGLVPNARDRGELLARGDGNVSLLGPLPHNETLMWLTDASTLVYPSTIETFGHPLAEALRAGTPIVAARSAINYEICGKSARYFDPDDPLDLISALNRPVPKFAPPRTYDWRACADQTAKSIVSFVERST